MNCLNFKEFKDCLDFKICLRSKRRSKKEKTKVLEERIEWFAVQILELADPFPNTEEGDPCEFYVIIQHFQEIDLYSLRLNIGILEALNEEKEILTRNEDKLGQWLPFWQLRQFLKSWQLWQSIPF